MVRRPSCRRGLAAILGAAIAVTGCGAGDDADGACGPITREALDPAYLVHVVRDDDGVVYTSDPPTSGPHQPSPALAGAVEAPISRPVQVGILERGDVVVQYDPALDATERSRLEDLAGEGVVVAPNPDLSAPIVATAWLYKRTCEEADVDALQELIDERRGKGPEE